MSIQESKENSAPESPRLLIVEDDPSLADVLASYFSYKRYQVEVLREGKTAAEAVRTTGPDVLLLDWRLPGKTGAEVLREVREEGIDTPAIMVSAHSENELKRKLGDPGADAYVTKPFDLEVLEDRVDALLS